MKKKYTYQDEKVPIGLGWQLLLSAVFLLAIVGASFAIGNSLTKDETDEYAVSSYIRTRTDEILLIDNDNGDRIPARLSRINFTSNKPASVWVDESGEVICIKGHESPKYTIAEEQKATEKTNNNSKSIMATAILKHSLDGSTVKARLCKGMTEEGKVLDVWIDPEGNPLCLKGKEKPYWSILSSEGTPVLNDNSEYDNIHLGVMSASASTRR